MSDLTQQLGLAGVRRDNDRSVNVSKSLLACQFSCALDEEVDKTDQNKDSNCCY